MRPVIERLGSGLISDSRFAGLVNNAPLFKKQRTNLDGNLSSKIQLDDRFKNHLASLSASATKTTRSSVDQYGRKLAKKKTSGEKDAANKELDKYYDLKDDKRSSSAQSKDAALTRLEYLNKLSRGEISEDESEEDEDDSSDSDEGSENESVHEGSPMPSRKRKRKD